MIITERVLYEGGRLPRGYGVAWREPDAFRAVCLPVPFNRIAGAFRAWWLELKRPCEDDPIVKAYGLGVTRGWADGHKAGSEHVHRLYQALHGASQ